MLRNLTWLAAILLVLAGSSELLAQDALLAQGGWPAYTTPFARGPGWYLAFWKIFLLLALFWIWVKSADWVSRDSVETGDAIGMPASIWNPVMVFSFLLVFMILVLNIPIFLAG